MDVSNQLNIQPFVSTGLNCYPNPEEKRGTISTVGVAVQGTDTLFLTEMVAGSYIYNASSNELRIVKSVNSDTLAYIDVAFGTDLSEVTPSVIDKNFTHVKGYVIAVATTADAQMADNNGELIPSLLKGQVFNFGKTGNDRSDNKANLTPIIVDATGTTVSITIIY